MTNQAELIVEKLGVPIEIAQQTIILFDDITKAEQWLKQPINALNGLSPLARIDTNEGIEEVKKILHKIKIEGFP